MNVTTILNTKTIEPKMYAKNKDEVLRQLADLLKEANYITNSERFVEDVYLREKEGITGIGNYIAIPHGKSIYVNEPGVAIGILDKEIPWETLDENGVKGIILFGVGDDNVGAEQHLKLLSSFAKKLGNDEVIETLLNAKDSDEVIDAFNI